MRACRWVQDLLQRDGMIVTKERGRICHHTFEYIQGDLFRNLLECGLIDDDLVLWNSRDHQIHRCLSLTTHIQGHTNITHGGVQLMILDEVLGNLDYAARQSGLLEAGPAVTAHIEVEFRQKVPVPSSVFATAQTMTTSGRKTWHSATLQASPNGPVYATGKALFIMPRQQQATTDPYTSAAAQSGGPPEQPAGMQAPAVEPQAPAGQLSPQTAQVPLAVLLEQYSKPLTPLGIELLQMPWVQELVQQGHGQRVWMDGLVWSNEPNPLPSSNLIKGLICSGMMHDHILLWERDVFRFTYILSLGHDVCGFPGLLHGGMICLILDEILSAPMRKMTQEGELPQGLPYTVRLVAKLIEGIPVESVLCCTSHLVRAEGRRSVFRGQIQDRPGGKTFATGEAEFVTALTPGMPALQKPLLSRL